MVPDPRTQRPPESPRRGNRRRGERAVTRPAPRLPGPPAPPLGAGAAVRIPQKRSGPRTRASPRAQSPPTPAAGAGRRPAWWRLSRAGGRGRTRCRLRVTSRHPAPPASQSPGPRPARMRARASRVRPFLRFEFFPQHKRPRRKTRMPIDRWPFGANTASSQDSLETWGLTSSPACGSCERPPGRCSVTLPHRRRLEGRGPALVSGSLKRQHDFFFSLSSLFPLYFHQFLAQICLYPQYPVYIEHRASGS